MDEDPELVSAPMRSLYEVTKLRNLRSGPVEKPKTTLLEEDFISRGYISLQEAEELFAYFSRTMNQLLWGGISVPHPDLTTVRRKSTLLTAAVLTVAALHIPNRTDTLNICYNEFVRLVSSTALTRSHTIDDIRAFCVGAFWLSDLSWKLSGQAVRIATEMGLHQSFQRLTRGHAEEHERAQLWYMLYVCDHHFSIAYGRPPVMHEDTAIKNYETYLQLPQTAPGDIRLMAQVALFVILTEAYRTFGSDAERALTEEDFGQLRVYNVAVDQWRLLWQPRSRKFPFRRIRKILSTDIVCSRQSICTDIPVQRCRTSLPLCQVSTEFAGPPWPVPNQPTNLLHGAQGMRKHSHCGCDELSRNGAGGTGRARRHRRRAHLHAHHGDLLRGVPA